jgi:phage protein D
MRPIYEITANDKQLNLNDVLISLRITDESGIKSDSCEIILADGPLPDDTTISLPNTGAKLDVYLGYEESGTTLMGSYIVNEIALSGAPNRVSVKAHAADLKSSLKEKTSASFVGKTIGNLVELIANKHGLVQKTSEDLAKIIIDHIDQTNESDMHFLTRLANKYRAVAKPVNGTLIFAMKGLAKSVSGIDLPTTAVDIGDVIAWSYTESKREDYGKVRAEYVNFDEGEIRENEVGNDGTGYSISGVSANKTDAEILGNTVLANLKRSHQKLQLSTIGNTDLVAESKVALTGFKPGIPTVWLITKAEHTLDSGGFKTQIEGEIYE